MAEVKWIKIVVDVFDDNKIRFLETLPQGDSVIVIWFKLLCICGKSNKGGFLMMTDKIPYTEDMLASIFNKDIKLVKFALETFEKLEMIEIVDNKYYITNWEKHQNLDALERIRQNNRVRVARHREKKRLELSNVTVTLQDTLLSHQCNAIDKDIDKEEDIERDKEKDYKDKLDKLDKTLAFASENHNPLTHELIRRKFITDSDLDIYRYDEFFESIVKEYDHKDLLQVISYVIKNMQGKLVQDKFNYFKSSILSNLDSLKVRETHVYKFK